MTQMAKKQVRNWWIVSGCQGKELGCCGWGDTLWPTAGTEDNHLKCMHITKGMPTGQDDGERYHAFF